MLRVLAPSRYSRTCAGSFEAGTFRCPMSRAGSCASPSSCCCRATGALARVAATPTCACSRSDERQAGCSRCPGPRREPRR
eukprot:6567511-Prymnesium_polylepis.1